MKRIAEGLFTAFSLYSIIPMPRTAWDRDSTRYALCFFPLIGMVIGVLQLLWLRLCLRWAIVPGLFASVAVLLPLAVTGGIHLDGFIDTVDAVSSHALMERKLEILKDPHVGAFGVIWCGACLLAQYGLWQQVYGTGLALLPALGYILSRCLNGLSIATFPCAKSSGLVHLFADGAARRPVIAVCALFILFCAVLALRLSLLWGGIFLLFAAAYFVFHRHFCIWEFGGNTGDLAGFLLQNLELGFLIIAMLGGVIG